ncbi:hypothetical protein [Pedobacter sp. GR22-6]|uniref:hypothetical protein n=1 Tax=Pedobacter sp. GR22-6 TaxID=3127957 RepID=UPI00307D1B5B
MKRTFISFFSVVILHGTAVAQSNFHKLSIGAGYGVTQSFTDVQEHAISFAGYGTADYFLTPFISLGGEFQMGQIRGGDIYTDPNEREFINSYKTANINGKLYLGSVINFNRNAFADAIKWFYVGAGAGIIRNDVERVVVKPSTRNTANPYVFPGKDKSTDLVAPLSTGINYYFSDRTGKPKFGINLNYQVNFSLGEGMDGYDDSPIKFKNGSPDVYTYLSFGFRYNFGLLGLSTKSLY